MAVSQCQSNIVNDSRTTAFLSRETLDQHDRRYRDQDQLMPAMLLPRQELLRQGLGRVGTRVRRAGAAPGSVVAFSSSAARRGNRTPTAYRHLPSAPSSHQIYDATRREHKQPRKQLNEDVSAEQPYKQPPPTPPPPPRLPPSPPQRRHSYQNAPPQHQRLGAAADADHDSFTPPGSSSLSSGREPSVLLSPANDPAAHLFLHTCGTAASSACGVPNADQAASLPLPPPPTTCDSLPAGDVPLSTTCGEAVVLWTFIDAHG